MVMMGGGGLNKIVNIKASMNRGLSGFSNVLTEARGARSAPLARGPVGAPRFPYVTPVEIPVVEYTENPDPHWLVGFVNGEGRLRGCEGGDKFLQALVCMQGFSCLPPTS
uniref:Uncharacterized protein n=1 Tax=Morchella importuna TaxID=1174673 RepID=A0A650AFC9_9PEZI|nr:hypothetical protein [Morchella importuna]QGN66697.1 hypothetical protein [Morchella importuna]